VRPPVQALRWIVLDGFFQQQVRISRANNAMFWRLIDVDRWRINALAFVVGSCVTFEKQIMCGFGAFRELHLR
jgi:hypothetical protein